MKTLLASTTLPGVPPPARAARIQVVDALRGFALIGILMAHSSEWFAAGGLPPAVWQAHAQGIGNGIAQTFVGVLVSGKFYTFFSFLFGLSFALMMTRSTETPGAFYRRFAWRLVVLGAIGFLHHLQWQGDILTIFAMLGFVLLLFARAPDRVILITAALLILNVPARLTHAYQEFATSPNPTEQKKQQQVYEKNTDTFYRTLKHGSYADVVKRNFFGFKDKMDFQFDSGRIYVTLGFFLLGLYAGRRRLFQRLDENGSFFRKLTKFSGWGVLGLTAVGAGLAVTFGGNQQPPKVVEVLFQTLFDLHSGLLTVFYIAGLTLVLQKKWAQRTVPSLAAVGKMGLTSYVTQTLIGTLLFMGYGLGWLGAIDVWQATLLTFPIFFAQVLFSRWWLNRFRFGPLEWLWRSLTYLKPQPMRMAP